MWLAAHHQNFPGLLLAICCYKILPQLVGQADLSVAESTLGDVVSVVLGRDPGQHQGGTLSDRCGLRLSPLVGVQHRIDDALL